MSPGAGVQPRACLICGDEVEPSDEHIIPRALWNRFGIDPNRPDLEAFRTTLCVPHNRATSSLHGRTEVLDLLEFGEPVTARSLTALADWAVWVTMLFGLSRGSAPLGAEASRQLLLERFDAGTGLGGLPKGVRVFAARVSAWSDPADPPITRYAVALHGGREVVNDEHGRPIGLSILAGPTGAAETIIIGKIALLVLARTISSGPDHQQRVDAAAFTLGLERIWPRPSAVPALAPVPMSSKDLSRLFKVTPFAEDHSLLPRRLMKTLRADEESTI